MGLIVGWIELLKQAAEAVEIHNPVVALFAGSAALGTAALYLLAFAWLAYRWVARARPRRRSRLSDGLRIGEGLLHVLSAVLVLTVGLLLAVARAAGRSTFHSGARF